jgi:cell filamentation protein
MPIMQKAEGQPFSIGAAIPAALGAVEKKLHAGNYLRGLPRKEFAERAADVMAEINTVHPFREGNGRTQRVFMEQLAHDAGHNLDFTVISKERMIQASIAAHERDDTSMMRRMFDEISDPERVVRLRKSIAALEKLDVDWNNRYVATITPGHSVELVLAGVAGDQFMARTRSEILFGRVSDLPKPRPQQGQTFTLTMPARTQQQGNA